MAVVLASAAAARSVALAGFGIDSLIEIFASVVVVWQLTGVERGRERCALRLIGAAFFALALDVLAQATSHPHHSPGGIAWLAATLAAMLLLARGKHATGERLGNRILLTEGHVTLVDAYLVGAVLVGLVLNAALGWWWADPMAGLVIVYYGVKEGWAAWCGEEAT